MNDQAVVDYLLANPEFFNQHAELLATIKLGDPYRQRAISLHERQVLLLREQQQQLTRTHAELLLYGQENETIISKIHRFTTRLLAERAPQTIPQAVLAGLTEIFDVPRAALRLWHLAEPKVEAAYAHKVDEAIRLFANHLTTPYCGANTGFAAAQWLTDAVDTPSLKALAAQTTEEEFTSAKTEAERKVRKETKAAAPTASVALIALRHAQHQADEAFGLLVLGSPDIQRFRPDMGTDFLVQIGDLVSAALSRLLP